MLEGVNSTAPNLVFRWRQTTGTLSNGPVVNDLNAFAVAGGDFVFEVEDTITGCIGSRSITVDEDTDAPIGRLPGAVNLPCDNSRSTLADSNYRTDTTGFSFTWLNRSGDTISNFYRLTGLSAERYTLIIENNTTGCTTTQMVDVSQSETPIAELSASREDFICGVDTVFLNISGSTLTRNGVVSWIGGTPETIGGDIFVTNGGDYQLVVTTENGACADTSEVVSISDLRQFLSVNAGPDLILNCDENQVDAAALTPSDPSWEILWISIERNTVVNPTRINGGFTEPGSYILRLTDPISQCIGLDTLLVTLPQDNLEVDTGQDQLIPCGGGDVQLSAAVVEAPDNQLTFAWNLLTGSGVLPSTQNITVSSPGIYEVIMQYTPTSCEVRDTVEVLNSDAFSLSADPIQLLACDEESAILEVTVDNPNAVQLSYSWRVVDGQILAGTEELEAIAVPGLYWLRAVSPNGCIDSVAVELQSSISGLSSAVATFSQEPCGGTTTLIGNLPTGIIGQWSAIDPADEPLISVASDSSATLVGARSGIYRFVYTLSSMACMGYSSDTISVEIQDAVSVKAEDELVVFQNELRDTIIDLSLNDIVSGEASYTLLDNTNLASLSEDGVITTDGITGLEELVFQYRVCDLECPNSCNDAQLRLISSVEAPSIEIPNAITPNNDGLNDAFIIDVLLRSPQDYPEARLIVFNRWGDVLYSAQPYQNDWKGTGASGETLPEGTYYYVLELDLNRGMIYKGDITVLP